ncbi:hypothetical protein CHCC20442_4331 [Bacillus licheniformis]|uniref:phage replisome organizer N-terminal domain-containing protein n=1 Tax=Bacillus licheniformis TaxID=1402 RepID=UPI0011A9633A|nr:phage replisome organizer N-terminal domain-containing protein [Bacillus licheniformis]TWK08618.1 hypothetical protein CHCC20442_4331 [Bacillus licheniformis]
MAEVKWIKLDVGLPDNKKIKRIRKLPDGNNVILFWVFLLSRAGESNQKGGLFFTENVPYTEEDLAADFDFSVEFVRFAIMTLEKYRMIELYDRVIFIKNWDEYQQLDKLEKIKEQNRIRQARYREKQQKLAQNNVTLTLGVTEDNAPDIDLDLELDKELDKDIEIDKEDLSGKAEPSIPYAEIVSYLNDKTGSKYRSTTSATRKLIKARFNEGFTVDDFKQVIDNQANEWLKDKKMARYLRPQTLFGTKFESYLNQPTKGPGGGGGYDTSEYDDLF